MNELNSTSIKNALNFFLDNKKPYLIIQFNNSYVQFLFEGNDLIMEAASELNLGNKTEKFKDQFAQIDFLISNGGNYAKGFTKNEVDLITVTTIHIIEKIYNVNDELILNYIFGD